MAVDRPPRQPAAMPDEPDRQAAAAALSAAVGEGVLTLAEFSDRVAAVWAAERADQLAAATAGLGGHPGIHAAPVASVISIFGDHHRAGRWRLPARLRVIGVFGDVYLDLCSAVCTEGVAEIRAWSLLGDLRVRVPDGVEVEATGFGLFGGRDVRLAPEPPLPGTPLVRVRVYSLLGHVSIRCSSAASAAPGWRRWESGGPSPPPPGRPVPGYPADG